MTQKLKFLILIQMYIFSKIILYSNSNSSLLEEDTAFFIQHKPLPSPVLSVSYSVKASQYLQNEKLYHADSEYALKAHLELHPNQGCIYTACDSLTGKADVPMNRNTAKHFKILNY